MIRVWIVFILLVGLIGWGVFYLIKKRKPQPNVPVSRFAAKTSAGEIWIQLYETDSREELNLLRMRLGEENLNFIAFEQAKRGLDGKAPPQFGVAIAKGHLSRGQSILTKLLS